MTQWLRVRVSGPSMVPTLHDGDRLLVRRGGSIRPGQVVVAVFRSLPDRPVVKRAAYEVEDGWWLTSDNEFAGGDSATHGVATVLGRVVWRRSPQSLRFQRIR
jgi:phage repressor protein C with HTH and peptisase S24 domain